MTAKARLVFEAGPRMGECIPLSEGRTVLGRQVGDILIDDKEISSIHAIISTERGGWHLMDLGSTNGICVDNRFVFDARLSHGVELSLGKTRFRFELLDKQDPDALHQKRDDGATLEYVIPGSTEVRVEVASADRPRRPRLEPALGDISADPVDFESNLSGTLVQERVVLELRVARGLGLGDVHRFSEGSILIGRRDGELVIMDPDISRSHAVLDVTTDGDVILRDLDSRNGTFVNARRVQATRLVSGDRIRLGSCELIIDIERRG